MSDDPTGDRLGPKDQKVWILSEAEMSDYKVFRAGDCAVVVQSSGAEGRL